MRNISRHEGKFEIIKRLPTSINGNPRYLVRIGGFTCKTPVDSTLGYSAPNYDGKEVIATIGTHYNTATLDTVWESK